MNTKDCPRGPLEPIVGRLCAQQETDLHKLDRYLEEAGHPENGDARLALRAVRADIERLQAEKDRRRRLLKDRSSVAMWLCTLTNDINAEEGALTFEDLHDGEKKHR